MPIELEAEHEAVVSIAAMPLFLASLRGMAFQYFWPEATWWNDQSIIVFLNLVALVMVAERTRQSVPIHSSETWRRSTALGGSGTAFLGASAFRGDYGEVAV